MLTQERLRELLHYEPETGVFTRRVGFGSRYPAGAVSGADDGDGYLRMSLDGRQYRAHRLAWLYVYGVLPKEMLDHRDGDKTNNRIANLRRADTTLNAENQRKAHKGNSSGLLGVSFDKRLNRWAAWIRASGKRKYLGRHATAEQAHAVYLQAKRQLHGGCEI